MLKPTASVVAAWLPGWPRNLVGCAYAGELSTLPWLRTNPSLPVSGSPAFFCVLQEKEISRMVCLAFGQKVCGFDLLRR